MSWREGNAIAGLAVNGGPVGPIWRWRRGEAPWNRPSITIVDEPSRTGAPERRSHREKTGSASAERLAVSGEEGTAKGAAPVAEVLDQVWSVHAGGIAPHPTQERDVMIGSAVQALPA